MLSFILGELELREYVATIIFFVFFAINLIFVSWFFEQMQILASGKRNVPFKWVSKWLLKKKKAINYSTLFFQMTLILFLLCLVGTFVCWIINHDSLNLALTGFLPFVSISGIASAVVFGNKESVISRYLCQNIRWSVYDELKNEAENQILRLTDAEKGEFFLGSTLRFPLKEKKFTIDHADFLIEKPNVFLSKMVISNDGVKVDVDCINGYEQGDDFYVQVCKDNNKQWIIIKKAQTEENQLTIQIDLVYVYNLYYFSEEGSFELIVNFEMVNNQLRIHEIYGKD